jgi:dihydrodipicolinate synthase/N-acetylneuraminate lyase
MKEWGILVPIVTPCSPTGELDEDGLRQVTDRMLAAGCHSIFAGSSTGRGPWLSREERARICRIVVDQVGSQVPVVAGCMSIGLEDMLENAYAMAEAGARAAVVTAPVYFKYSQAELARIFLNFAGASPLPVMLYDIPDFTGIKMSKEIILRLAQHENIIGIKDSTDDFARFQELLVELQVRPDFYVLQGKERWLADSLSQGASGFVVSMIHLAPDLFAALYRDVRSGNLDRARQIQAEISRVMDLVAQMFQRRPETSTLFHFFNQVLRLQGACENIILEQDGACPDWLVETAAQAYAISCSARNAILKQ